MTVTLETRRHHIIARHFADPAAARAFCLAVLGRPDVERVTVEADGLANVSIPRFDAAE